MDRLTDPAFIAALTGLVTAIATLVTVLKTHSDIQTVKTQTNGQLAELSKTAAAALNRVPGGRRSTDPPAPDPPAQPPASPPPAAA